MEEEPKQMWGIAVFVGASHARGRFFINSGQSISTNIVGGFFFLAHSVCLAAMTNLSLIYLYVYLYIFVEVKFLQAGFSKLSDDQESKMGACPKNAIFLHFQKDWILKRTTNLSCQSIRVKLLVEVEGRGLLYFPWLLK